MKGKHLKQWFPNCLDLNSFNAKPHIFCDISSQAELVEHFKVIFHFFRLLMRIISTGLKELKLYTKKTTSKEKAKVRDKCEKESNCATYFSFSLFPTPATKSQPLRFISAPQGLGSTGLLNCIMKRQVNLL